MSKEILLVIEVFSNERGVEPAIVFDAVEAALASATRRKHGDDRDVRVAIDTTTGDYDTFRRWEVIDENDEEQEIESLDRQISLEDARKQQADIEAGGFIEEAMESVEFGRISAQAAKQVIVQKIRDAERAKVAAAYAGREGELVTGVVKRADRGNVTVDLGNNSEAMISKQNLIPRETMRPGDRVRP